MPSGVTADTALRILGLGAVGVGVAYLLSNVARNARTPSFASWYGGNGKSRP
jgi:hypothetical protein